VEITLIEDSLRRFAFAHQLLLLDDEVDLEEAADSMEESALFSSWGAAKMMIDSAAIYRIIYEKQRAH